MLKNKNLLKAAIVFALSIGSLSVFAGAAGTTALGSLLGDNSINDLVQPSAPLEINVIEDAPGKADGVTLAVSPKPGSDFTPRIEDASRIKSMMKLITDIYNGVHLPYSQDGSTFTNREGRLPVHPLGFYKEYTLLTGDAPHTVVVGGTTYQVAPDLSARGSERMIIGGGEKIYYTPDHYAHFIELTVVN